ncbi:hypothetical protein OIU77_027835 [Salix suchowensis]|uniref:Pentatricopeptide repeat-containing protein n=1 Tax=Salix suchowensis TaxID=1278906 RepID=A0ABQ9BR12_9ROSI|nr:hypothetical protein OIU77_027835 [Salix suchowensis]
MEAATVNLKASKPQLESSLDSQDFSPSARLLFEIITRPSSHDIESALSSTGIPPTHDIVHEVLKLCYENATAAITFFRWAGRTHKLTSYAWNLMVDLLGKNWMYEPMWDAVRSMKQEDMLSMTTFVSVFGSYCMADTYAILLEGWEKEGNVAKAKTTFDEMVTQVGWSPENMSAYDSFLTTLVRGLQADEAVKFLQVMKGKNCLPGLNFFSNALDTLAKQNDSTHAISLWDIMASSGLLPNSIMYNAMIGLHCNNNDVDNAFRLLDEMVFNGAFPDFLTFSMIFRCLIKNKKVHQVGKFFYEMIKNECPPTPIDCSAAIMTLTDGGDPEMAIEIWNYLVENHIMPLDGSANALLIGFCNLGRMSQVRRFAEDMLDRRINIYESTMKKLKNTFDKTGRHGRDKYDCLIRRWKAP